MLQQKTLVAAFRTTGLDITFKTATVEENQSDILCLQNILETKDVNLGDVSESDTNITYFVSGYIGRSVTRRRKCGACKEQLLNAARTFDLPDSASQEHADLYEMVDRGGLSARSELCFSIIMLAFKAIMLYHLKTNLKLNSSL